MYEIMTSEKNEIFGVGFWMAEAIGGLTILVAVNGNDEAVNRSRVK
jgi:hypothetical protein